MYFGVVMLSHDFYPSVGGAQTHTLRLSQKLRARGADVRVITRYYKGLERYEEIDGIPIYRVGLGGRHKAAAPVFVLEALRMLYVQRVSYDILHCHMMYSAMTVGLLARLLTRKPLVINPHGRGPMGDVGRLMNHHPLTGHIRLEAARRWGSAFVCVSRSIREELRGIGVAEAKLWDIVNGVDTEHFSPRMSPGHLELRQSLNLPSGPLVVFAGRLSLVKGVDILLEAWPEVLRHLAEAHLLILGEGEQRAKLEAQAQRLGIAARLTFVSGCHDVAPYLRAADAFVLPSYSEGSPVALLEAMACSLPSVATANSGTLQVIEDGVTGRLVPVANPQALARGFIEALTVPEAQRWGTQARQHVITHHSLDAVADRYIVMYETLLLGGNPLDRRTQELNAKPQ